ncbi:GNAT family N-acetyltransferase [Streptomyces sp. JJ36]|uniref:GNAT family N-acetyltransferase n=1 Tax=Streptomyces sp. JJ36 TaxID=2736645 RepID=UPI001F336222|nr:GNAT family N-acetyltransferase [Streptomyces sp. JJ36]MCF6522249.1 GNAT family N-acetyltransferase [Streptomyces sp. JJ36]
MIRIETAADEDRRALLEQRLEETNARLSPVLGDLRGTADDDERPVQLYAVEDGALVGGLVGYAWGRWLHIDLLWVDARHRGGGLGTRLMDGAEARAAALGCAHARVETWGFQAPDFYRKRGYRVVGVVEDYPPGETDHLLVKPLTAARAPG